MPVRERGSLQCCQPAPQREYWHPVTHDQHKLIDSTLDVCGDRKHGHMTQPARASTTQKKLLYKIQRLSSQLRPSSGNHNVAKTGIPNSNGCNFTVHICGNAKWERTNQNLQAGRNGTTIVEKMKNSAVTLMPSEHRKTKIQQHVTFVQHCGSRTRLADTNGEL